MTSFSFPRIASWILIFFQLFSRIEGQAGALENPLFVPNDQVSPRQSTGGFVDTTTCYTSLTVADEDQSGGLDRDEYVTFLRLTAPEGAIPADAEFVDVPLLLQSNYFLIACLCSSRGGNETCCVGDNANIDISGASPGTIPNDDELSYLFLTCWLTSTTIDQVIDEFPDAPTSAPVSALPSVEPTLAPSSMTPAPSIPPSDTGSALPTVKATPAPSSQASGSPTAVASDSPTMMASGNPTVTSSAAPTATASGTPTVTASITPTTTASGAPTVTASGAPTTIASATPTVMESGAPTVTGSDTPTVVPSTSPSEIPSVVASTSPTSAPSLNPTVVVSGTPTSLASGQPSESPSEQLSGSPSVEPSAYPSLLLTDSPTTVDGNVGGGSPAPEDPGPTAVPTLSGTTTFAPTTTTSPSSMASQAPTSSQFPTIASPTSAPSAAASDEPSINPSEAPSEAPSTLPSTQPSEFPSEMPSAKPSEVPSEIPSTQPSATLSELPSASPSEVPSEIPSTNPSEIPSDIPSANPSEAPSDVPSDSPTPGPTISSSPSTAPSLSLSPSISPEPSATPTMSPSAAPSPLPSAGPTGVTEAPVVATVDAISRTTYSINVVNGLSQNIPPTDYSDDLIGAMDIVAIEAATTVDGILGRRSRLRRKLAVLVDLPTSIDAIVNPGGFTTRPALVDGIFTGGACPADLGNPETDRCEEVAVSIGLFAMGSDPVRLQVLFEEELDKAILAGRLQTALDEVNPDSVVQIMSGREATGSSGIDPPNVNTTEDDDEGGDGLSVGASVGITLAAAAVLCLLGSLCFLQGNRDKGNTSAELKPVSNATGLEWGATDGEEKDIESDPAGISKPDQAARLAPVSEQPSSSQDLFMDAGSIVSGDYSSKRDAYSQQSGISHENSSGWSDVYASSMGTMESDDLMPGAQVVDIAANISADSGAMEQQETNPGITNLEDLEAAIVSGDWAAVGASAALLAANQYDSAASQGNSQSQSKSTLSNFSSLKSKGSTWQTELDTRKAAELDSLIESGNWEGVIQAAAKFEAEANSEVPTEMHSDSGSDSGDVRSHPSASGSHPSSGYVASTGSGVGSGSGTTPSMSTMSGETTKARTREEIRAEVLELVERVVPEEIDHVDEMMAQFLGREDELLETLRTMQERDVAQKSRRVEQRKAKLGATDRSERDRRRLAAIEASKQRQQQAQHQLRSQQQQPSQVQGPMFVAADESSPSDTTTAGSSGAVANPSSLQTDEAGNLLTSTDSSSDDRTRHRNALYAAIDAGNWDAVGEAAAILSESDGSRLLATFESSTSGSTSDTRTRNRREEMTHLIERGDWLQVVVAASRYSEADALAASGRAQDERERQLQEEKEARRQAAIWMQVAQQSKAADGSSDEGAADAADWAIAQSLRRLEQEKKDKQQDDASSRDTGGDESI